MEKENIRTLILLDTTLRDGDQSPGFAFSRNDKVLVAHQLECLGVDIIEGGFPAASQSQYEDIAELSRTVEKSTLAAMSRAIPSEIITCARSLRSAKRGLIHTFIGTSPLHREKKMRMSGTQIIAAACEAVRCAKDHAALVEIGAEDATRTEIDFLCEFCAAVIAAGADIVNISDTAGYIQVAEYARLVGTLIGSNGSFADGTTRLSVHCHNDFGLATANTLAGVCAGASQAEVTLSGIGERAGNAALEEVVTALQQRGDYYKNIRTNINSNLLAKSAFLLSAVSACPLSPLKPVTGFNAFSHASGVHQHGNIADEKCYAVFLPEDVGRKNRDFQIGPHSGKAGITAVIKKYCPVLPGDAELAALCTAVREKAAETKILPYTQVLRLLYDGGFTCVKGHTLKSLSFSGIPKGKGVRVLLETETFDAKTCYVSEQADTKKAAILAAVSSLFAITISNEHYSFAMCDEEDLACGTFTFSAWCEGNEYAEYLRGNDCNELYAGALLSLANRVLALRYANEYNSEKSRE